MKNIIKVFLNDCKHIGRNVVALVVVMGLAVLPSLYAWFNILSNWDPYGPESTSNIKVAVAYDDTGINISGMDINISTNIVEALKTNDTIGWVFTDSTDEAIEGVWSGDYYAALIMPADFSKDMVSFLADNMTHPEIIYYTNQKKNAIAPKITDKAKTAVQQQVNATFISTLTEAIMKSADVAENIGDKNKADSTLESGSDSMNNSLIDILIAKFQVINTQVVTFDNVLSALSNIITTAQTSADTAKGISPDISGTFEGERAILNELNKTIGQSSLIDSSLFSTISHDIDAVSGYMNSISSIYNDMGYNIDDFNKSISQMGESINNTLVMVRNIEDNLNETTNKLVEFKNSGVYSLLQTAISFNTDELASFISAPVAITTEDLYPITNYGSAMSPFYSVLSIWVGALILVAIIHVKVHPFDGIKVNSVEAFFGRYITFFLIGQAQALLITLGDLFFIGIQCIHPFKFWFAAAFTSFVFTMITYSLTVAFENVGEAAAVVIMVIQVAGAGGTFPIQCLPAIYQAIYKYLPFTYAMDALRECVGGTYSWYYWKCILALLVYVGICLFIGLVIAKPCRKLNAIVDKSKEKSEIMI
ncbi:MAG TPA: YhgE/Pip domain-containing protein [Eubacterium sp.]|jgi:YhgE/Pip-like protein|nr:YhgE/Pip domain-containing protein [Eubacterium sp.]